MAIMCFKRTSRLSQGILQIALVARLAFSAATTFAANLGTEYVLSHSGCQQINGALSAYSVHNMPFVLPVSKSTGTGDSDIYMYEADEDSLAWLGNQQNSSSVECRGVIAAHGEYNKTAIIWNENDFVYVKVFDFATGYVILDKTQVGYSNVSSGYHICDIGGGSFLCMWSSAIGTTGKIYAKKLTYASSSGSYSMGSQNLVEHESDCPSWYPRGVQTGDGTVVCVYQKAWNPAYGTDAETWDWDIKAKVLNLTGVPLTSEYTLDSSSDKQTQPRVAFSGRDLKGLVVWEEKVTSSDIDLNFSTFSYNASANDISIEADDVNLHVGTYKTWMPDVAFDFYNKKFLVVYSRQYSENDNDIWAQEVGLDGSFSTASSMCSASGNQLYPSVAYNKNKDYLYFLVTWNDYRDGFAYVRARSYEIPIAFRTLEVYSDNVTYGVNINVTPWDWYGDAGGNTYFSRLYQEGTAVTLSAPGSVWDSPADKWKNFSHWSDGYSLYYQNAISFNMNGNYTLTAYYIDAPLLIINPDSRSHTFAYTSGQAIDVTANVSWTASASESLSWVTITKGASGSGDGTVTYSVTQNTSASSRSGYINISGGGITRSFEVYQAGAPTYTVSYNANEAASGTAQAPQKKTHDVALALASNSGGLAKTGNTFSGWNTTPNGSGTDYAAGGSYTDNASVTLYAKWTPIAYTVVYDGNESTDGSTASSSHTYDVPAALTANGFTRTGYTFAGWATTVDGEVAYSDGQSVMNLANTQGATVTLYAQWTSAGQVAMPVFDPDGGAHPGGSVNVTITCATEGVTIRYASGSGTTPGADPTTASTAVPASGIVNVPVPGWLKAKAWKDGMTESAVESAVYTGVQDDDLADAVDAPTLTWTTGGDANWFGQTATTHDGMDAAQSGDIANYQQSWMQATVTGPGTLSFWWKVSSENNFDWLRFYIDGNEQESAISGSVDWQQKVYTIPSGSHTLKWQYTKDGSSSSGTDCGWVDQVVYEPSYYLAVNPSSVSVSQGGGTGFFSVSANVSWSVSDDASWLTVSPLSRSGNATVTVNATSANTGTSERSATVTVSGGGITRTATVIQPGVNVVYYISTSSNPSSGGSTSGGGSKQSGSSCTVTATAANGYRFANWTEGGTVVSTSASYTFTVARNRTLTANFTQSPVYYTMTTGANPSSGGTTSGGGSKLSGSSCTVRATPASGYTFSNWTEGGTMVSSSASYTFTVTRNRTLTANFTRNLVYYTITTGANPSSGGATAGGGSKQSGSSCTVAATAVNGYRFVNWTEGGTVVSTSASYTFTVARNRTLTANFAFGGGDGDGYLCDPVGDAELATAGSYDGYLHTEQTFNGSASRVLLGTVAVKVTKPQGRLTAKVALQSGNISFSAREWTSQDGAGTRWARLTARGGEMLDLFVRQNRVWGRLAGGRLGGETLSLDGARNRFADRGDAAAQSVLSLYQGYYTAEICGICRDGNIIQGALNAAPRGNGYLTLTVGAGGRVKIAGVLADGTRVSRSAPLIWVADCGEWLCMPFFAPLYAKRGWIGSLIRVDPQSRRLYNDAEAGWDVRWVKPASGPDWFDMVLDVFGGFYNRPAALRRQYALALGADWDSCLYHHAGGAEECAFAPEELPVTVSGSRLTVPRGTRPLKVGEDGAVWYEYEGDNPSMATLSFSARTGIFKGRFTVYYDFYDASGRFQHKAVKVPYAGVMLADPETGGLQDGSGYALFPDNDPAVRAYRVKRSFPVSLSGE